MRSLSIALVALTACAGTQQEDTAKAPTTPTAPTAPTAPAKPAGDVVVELPPSTIKAAPLEPTALTRPDMPLVNSKRGKTTLDKQRAAVAAAKDPVIKQLEAAVLATMLWGEAKKKNFDKALIGEARQVLRDTAAAVGDAALDEITLRLLGSYEIMAEDFAAAEKAWQGVIDKDPKSKELPYNRAWLAYAKLRQFKNAEALAVVSGEKLDDKQPELAYVIAWAKLRTGDATGAWEAAQVAAKGWGKNANRDELERDSVVIAGRAQVPVDQVVAALNANLGQGKAPYELVARLGNLGYAPAGRWTDAIAALDKSIIAGGDTLPQAYRVRIRYAQAECAVAVDAIDVATRYAKEAVDGLATCGDKCTDKERTETIASVYYIGRLFHVLFATANDKKFYQPAHDLYALTIPLLPEAQRGQAQRDAKTLEDTAKNIKAGTGTHEKSAVGALLARRDTEVQACYETALGANPKLGGTLAVELESDATGQIKGVATDPKAGDAELAAVAGCVAARAKAWRLPTRGMPGTTRIKLSYSLQLKK